MYNSYFLDLARRDLWPRPPRDPNVVKPKPQPKCKKTPKEDKTKEKEKPKQGTFDGNDVCDDIHSCSQLQHFKTRVNDYKTNYQYMVAVRIVHYCLLVVGVVVSHFNLMTITPHQYAVVHNAYCHCVFIVGLVVIHSCFKVW